MPHPPLRPPLLAPLPPRLPGMVAPGAIVAIPAREAAGEIAACLLALNAQRNEHGLRLAPGAFGVLLLVHGGRDQTAERARALAPRLGFPLLVQEAALPAVCAAAGWAGRAAMELAAEWLDRGGRPDGVVLTTTAAARPEPGWVAANLAAIAEGAEAVAGLVRPLDAPALTTPAERYARLLQALAARLDPEPDDPWPRHGCEDSASLAVTLHALDRLAGLPCGQGAAGLLEALRREDGRIRHAPGAVVRLPAPAAVPLEGLHPALHRLRARSALRRLWWDGIGTARPETPALWRWAARLGLPPGCLGGMLTAPYFGAAWAAVVAASPALAQRPLAPAGLPAALLGARLALALAVLRRRNA